MTAGGRHSSAHIAGAVTVATAAIAPEQRAPDLVVGLDMQTTGWVGTAPPLAIEYAGVGQDEAELSAKITELFEFGARLFWVVRLTGPLRVEIHVPGASPRIVDADGMLTAPGILESEVPVRALIDPPNRRRGSLAQPPDQAGLS